MRIVGKKIILKVKKKNIGNKKLRTAMDQLSSDLENFNSKKSSIIDVRKDAD